ncbi:hypothetical protein C8A05DRAFT_47053 [Staphylotrichum tortipilum]|uniref:Uncharacterized protein n=1 Tax=Staphylotrichum tortipilum TaxID=2831512 RepID=A0AAN6MEP4_9PEZI|nr:hypothetical protein C8A05DRAFT_47053 [Staphylotrichum longicolle]
MPDKDTIKKQAGGPPLRGQIPAPPPANTYTPQDRDTLQHKSADATEEHLVLATDLVVGKLAANRVPYALMGGFSLRIRGSARLTLDADLAVGGTMLALKTAISGDPRILLPRGPVSGVMRAYVRVGGPLNSMLSEVPVCVDLITEGSLGAPDNILGGSEEVEGMTDAGMRTYRVVDMQHILASKLAAFHARGNLDSNDFKDLLWILLTSNHSAQVREVSGNLSLEDKQVFLAAVLRSRPKLSAGRIQRIKQLLRMA